MLVIPVAAASPVRGVKRSIVAGGSIVLVAVAVYAAVEVGGLARSSM